MTLTKIQKRLDRLERKVGSLETALEHQRAVEGIRRGLESEARGEGEPLRHAFAEIRRKHRSGRRK